MDSNSNAAAAATASDHQGRRWQRKHVLKAVCECVLVAIHLLQSCSDVVVSEEQQPRRLRLQAFAGIALSYAAAVALTLFARRLEARGQRHGREAWLNAAARGLASLVLLYGLPIWRTGYLMASSALFTFVWG